MSWDFTRDLPPARLDSEAAEDVLDAFRRLDSATLRRIIDDVDHEIELRRRAAEARDSILAALAVARVVLAAI